jgi:2-dehydropantoate 2-reductase
MRILFFGAGPLGSVYAHLLHESGADVTVLDRGERYAWLSRNGLVLQNEMTGQRATSTVEVVSALEPEDQYDLVIVLIRKNRLAPVFDTLAACPGIENILFMGNNALGFDQYTEHLPAAKLLFGFPGAGGGLREQVVCYADRRKPRANREAITLGEIDGQVRARTNAIRSLFESADVPVNLVPDIDAWLKYHVALISPLVGALYKHDCDTHGVASDRETLRTLIRAANEGARVLRALGFSAHEPVEFKLFRWLPELISTMGLKGLFESRFAEIAFGMHARAARDEMRDLAREFEQLTARTSVDTPHLEALRRYIG